MKPRAGALWLLLSSVLPAGALPAVSISPPSTIASIGSTVSLDVAISGVADLYAFQFDVTFDPSVLAATDVSEGPFLPGGGATFFIPGIIDNVGGSVAFTADTLLGPVPGVTGDGILATLTFTAVAAGTSPIALENVILLDSVLGLIEVVTDGGQVTVPEAATLLLLGSGIVGATLTRLRLRQWRFRGLR
jgi:general secretion pathway protein D